MLTIAKTDFKIAFHNLRCRATIFSTCTQIILAIYISVDKLVLIFQNRFAVPSRLLEGQGY